MITCDNCPNNEAYFCAKVDLVPLELPLQRFQRSAGRMILSAAQTFGIIMGQPGSTLPLEPAPLEPARNAVSACIRAHNPGLIIDRR